MANIRARITFFTAEEGGLKKVPQSGVRSQLKINDVFTSCIVWGTGTGQSFELGKEHEVKLELLFWEQYQNLVFVGMPIQLNEGNRIVAKGTVDAIEK